MGGSPQALQDYVLTAAVRGREARHGTGPRSQEASVLLPQILWVASLAVLTHLSPVVQGLCGRRHGSHNSTTGFMICGLLCKCGRILVGLQRWGCAGVSVPWGSADSYSGSILNGALSCCILDLEGEGGDDVTPSLK